MQQELMQLGNRLLNSIPHPLYGSDSNHFVLSVSTGAQRQNFLWGAGRGERMPVHWEHGGRYPVSSLTAGPAGNLVLFAFPYS